MKKKILIIIFIGVVVTFFIYKWNKQEKVFFLALGDGLATGMTAYNIEGYNYNDYIRDELEKENKLDSFVHEFAKSDGTVENLITSIENNYLYDELNITIQQALSKARLITIGIGMDELAHKSIKQILSTKEKEEYLEDVKMLLKLVRNFNVNEIYLLGIYKAYNMKESDVTYLNNELAKIAESFNIKFIDIADLATKNDYFSKNDSYYFNYKGHREIKNRILSQYYT